MLTSELLGESFLGPITYLLISLPFIPLLSLEYDVCLLDSSIPPPLMLIGPTVWRDYLRYEFLELLDDFCWEREPDAWLRLDKEEMKLWLLLERENLLTIGGSAGVFFWDPDLRLWDLLSDLLRWLLLNSLSYAMLWFNFLRLIWVNIPSSLLPLLSPLRSVFLFFYRLAPLTKREVVSRTATVARSVVSLSSPAMMLSMLNR